MKTIDADLAKKFATVLKCRAQFIGTRLIALGHKETCGRCGGSGSYSYCQMYGSTCFGCSGAGGRPPKLTETLFATVAGQVARGELDQYIETLKRRAAAKVWSDRLFAAWAAQPEVAADKAAGRHWSYQSELCAAINAICAPLHHRLSTLESLLRFGHYDKTARKYTPATDAEVAAAAAEAEELIARAANSQAEAEKTQK